MRLRHEDKTNVTFVVLHPTRKYRRPYLCPVCNITHTKKAYHLRLDSEGCVIVSPEVYERLRECGLPHLTVENEVGKPPSQIVGMGATGAFEVVIDESSGNKLLVLTRKLFAPRKGSRYG